MPISSWRQMRRPADEDTAAAQLRDMERQGAHLAGLAHLCASVLILLFSLGSLISLSAEAFNTVLSSWHRGALDIPAAISVAVSTLLVLAMDTGMLYAASVLRMLATRGAGAQEARVHRCMMISAALLEAATYTYMSWLYDRPATGVLWAIVLARALAAPLYAVYLSMARPLPVSSRDIFAQAELAAGRGVLRDVTTLANDSGASLDKKLRVYGAASVMADRERRRLAELIEAVSAPDMAPLAPLAIEAPEAARFAGERIEEAQEGAPFPGELLAAAYPPVPLTAERSTASAGALDPGPQPDPPAPGGGTRRPSERSTSSRRRAPESVIRLVSDRPRRADAGRRSAEAQARWTLHTDTAAGLLGLDPLMSTRELARRLSAQIGERVSAQRATEVRRTVQPVRPIRQELAAADMDTPRQSAQGEGASA